MKLQVCFLLLALAPLVSGQGKYTGPRPPKPDLPYLLHASHLVPTEAVEAKEDNRKDEVLYTVDGASSSARTPLASPIFIMQSVKISPESLQLFKIESKNGRREILFKKKSTTEPIRMEVTRLTPDGIYKLEVDNGLKNGEYVLSPEGSNQVFCFEIF
ncbi:MAG TPA: hypothetical protein VG675_23265 [Bryobacteraceae bacterium]|nr:hypothetical protein [Bryobacteraceae bacterium]